MKYLITLLLLTPHIITFGQGEPKFTMYWNNYTLFNPANTGLNYNHYLNISYRNQWNDLIDAPKSFAGQYETKINSINSGIGIGAISSIIGISHSNKYYFNYAYHIKLDKDASLSFGLSTVFQTIQYKGVFTTAIPNDPSVPPTYTPQTKLNISIGSMYKKNNLEIGLSFTQINKPYYDVLHFRNAIHAFIMASYKFELSDFLTYKPSVFIKSNFTINDVGIINLLTYDDTYWFGLTYYTSNSISLNVGVDLLKKYRMGYCFEYNMTDPFYKYPSHEFTIGFLFK